MVMNSSAVIYENGSSRLCLDDGKAILFYKGETYTFGCHPYEPMAIICKDDAPIAYIHNAFDVGVVCQDFMTNPEHLVDTVTHHYHNAEHFCRLLTIAIDRGYDWQIDELEKEMFEQVRWENHEVFYKTDDIEFGRYDDEPEDEIDLSELDEEPDTDILEHSEYEILYVVIDGVRYVLRGDWISTLSLIIAGEKGKKAQGTHTSIQRNTRGLSWLLAQWRTILPCWRWDKVQHADFLSNTCLRYPCRQEIL